VIEFEEKEKGGGKGKEKNIKKQSNNNFIQHFKNYWNLPLKLHQSKQ
jgi:hypothetical protein